MTEDLREELDQAALATQQAYVAARGGSPGNFPVLTMDRVKTHFMFFCFLCKMLSRS